jgi:hypothetical protein
MLGGANLHDTLPCRTLFHFETVVVMVVADDELSAGIAPSGDLELDLLVVEMSLDLAPVKRYLAIHQSVPQPCDHDLGDAEDPWGMVLPAMAGQAPVKIRNVRQRLDRRPVVGWLAAIDWPGWLQQAGDGAMPEHTGRQVEHGHDNPRFCGRVDRMTQRQKNDKPARRQPHTERQYAAAQKSFRIWCTEHLIRFPPSHDNIANYLYHCATERGPSVAAVHLSAIGRMYRDLGRRLDVKAPAIQQVIADARAEIRAGSAGDDVSVHVRLSATVKQQIEQAAATRGQALTSFIASAAYDAAQKITQRKRRRAKVKDVP